MAVHNHSFESIAPIGIPPNLQKKTQIVWQRDNLRADLESKFTVIYRKYALGRAQVQDQYEKFQEEAPLVQPSRRG